MMNDFVSVLMPAYKPDHFRQALQSVVRQTHEDLEILVGDNAGTGEIAAIVDEINDRRVTLLPNHRVTGGSAKLNHLILWHRARGRHARFVYDDDVIYERSTEALLAHLQQVPGCAFAWHQREIINEQGVVTARPGVLREDQGVVLDRALLLANMTQFLNFVGEPSFLLFDRTVAEPFQFNRHGRFELAFLWDIAMVLDATRRGYAAGSGERLGGFRVHSGQVSASANVFGALEWELVFRQELCEGALTIEQFHAVLPKLLGLYQAAKQAKSPLPGVEAMQARLLADAQAGRLKESTPAFIGEYQKLVASRAAATSPAPALMAEAVA